MAACAMTGRKVEDVEFAWSLAALCTQTPADTRDLDLIFSQDSGQPAQRHLKKKWFSKCENKPKPELSTTGLLAFSVITASQGNQQLRDSLQVALTIMSAKDHERYFQRIPALCQHRMMFRAYVDVCLKFINVCDSKNGALNPDTEVIMVWSALLEPLGEMLNMIFKDYLLRASSQWLINIPKPDNLDDITESLKSLEDDGIYEQFYNYDFDGDHRFQNGVQQIMLRLTGGKQEAGQQSLDLLLQAKLFYFSRFYFEIGLQGYEAWLNEKCEESYQPITENDDTNVEEKDELVSLNETGNKAEDFEDTISEEDAVEGNVIETKEDTALLTDEEKVRQIGDTEKQQQSSATGHGGSGAVANTETNDEGHRSVGLSGLQHSDGTETSSTLDGGLNTNLTFDPKQDDVSISATESADGTDNRYPTSFMQMIQLVQDGKQLPGVEHLVIEPTNKPPTESKMQRTEKPWQQ